MLGLYITKKINLQRQTQTLQKKPNRNSFVNFLFGFYTFCIYKRCSFLFKCYFSPFIESEILFLCKSTSSTLTITCCPSDTTVVGSLTYLSASCEMWTSPFS